MLGWPSEVGNLPVMADLIGTIQRMSRARVHTKKITYYFGNPSTWVSVVSTGISMRTDATNLLATILGCRRIQPADPIFNTSYDMTGCLIPKQTKKQTTCLEPVLDRGTRRTCRILRVPRRSSRAAPASFDYLGALPYLSRLSPAQAPCILKE